MSLFIMHHFFLTLLRNITKQENNLMRKFALTCNTAFLLQTGNYLFHETIAYDGSSSPYNVHFYIAKAENKLIFDFGHFFGRKTAMTTNGLFC